MKKRSSKLFKKIACIDPRPLEVTLAIQALLIGLFFLSPGDAFGTTQVYHVLSLIMPEGLWGLLFIATGILGIMAITTGKLRGSAITLALFLWLIVDLSSWISNVNSGATVSYLTFVIMAMWAAIAVSARDYFNCDR